MSCLVILAHWSFCMLMIVSLLPTVGAVRNWLNKNKRGNTKWLTLTLLMDFLGFGCPMTWIQVTTRFAEPLGLIWRCRNLDSPVYKNIGSCSAWLGTCVLWVCELLLVFCGGGSIFCFACALRCFPSHCQLHIWQLRSTEISKKIKNNIK